MKEPEMRWKRKRIHAQEKLIHKISERYDEVFLNLCNVKQDMNKFYDGLEYKSFLTVLQKIVWISRKSRR